MVTYVDDILSRLPLREPTFFILLSLSPGPKHGYAILKKVKALSKGRVRLSIRGDQTPAQ
jgi:DNA-binding PadR family transcriptional regulator